jgi:uncharacterized membrane protein YeaQ/YmgE (transglycosylase-associated protein family)
MAEMAWGEGRSQPACKKTILDPFEIRLEIPSGRMRQNGRGDMELEALIIWLIVGAIAGWLAGQVMKGGGFGLVGDIVLGIVGAFVAGWLLPRIGILIGGGILGAIINAFIGACVVLFIVRLIKR